LPPLTAVILIPFRNYPNLQGGPFGDPYLSHNVHVPDGPPVVLTVLISSEDAQQFVNNLTSVIVDVQLQKERGPWNDIFLSVPYRVYVWCTFTINLLLTLFGIFRMYQSISQRAFQFDLRTVIFVTGLISAAIYTAAIPMREESWTRYFLEQFSSFFYACAFYLLLMLWCGVLATVQTRQSFLIFRSVVGVGILCATYTAVLGVVWLCIWPNDALVEIRAISRIVTPVVQGFIGALFGVYAVRFFLRRQAENATKRTREALSKLGKLAIVGFITFISYAVTNVLSGAATLAGLPGVVVMVLVCDAFCATVRGAGILLVMSVRLPQSKQPDHGTASMTGSSPGTGIGTLLNEVGLGSTLRRIMGIRRASNMSDASSVSSSSTYRTGRGQSVSSDIGGFGAKSADGM